ncbi:MAG: translation initiation factor IF-2 subunit alpha [Candidatus Thermoplasmatota archaeon]|nr:translation initiation factor IF-2 subunit alpha [Euryarchaeota archaeon]MBU4031530.1 translation initiation factor IF-2 subunit alpha [Candidatus Thermoplasmatota archaeon]MBU4071997.1 translation initiation factor IF-2 subunit alpha [Candidatus Thermoplasmatota archaeon]MBU4144528.1 translation initiation factor IF-2 subunit alpha [Candidatus Thermoplasmatota archaeon]MBU4592077.1 translation initiation factor IF-2 subunit alpha [Candidatus Thermoplasmatota archaeon]
MEPETIFPEEGDLVVCTVKSVRNFGAFVELEEYPGKEGFIHVAEIATGWVKRMSDYVRDGQRIVCKVMNVDSQKGHIDLSLKKVNSHQKREKIQEWKNEQKATKLIEIVAERLGITVPDFRAKHSPEIIDEFGGHYVAFEIAAEEGVLSESFKGEWVDIFIQVAKENVTVSTAKVDGVIEITCPGGDGIENIKSALMLAEEADDEGTTIKIQYMGAPNYRIVVTAPEFKVAEELIRRAADKAIKEIQKFGGTAKFERS